MPIGVICLVYSLYDSDVQFWQNHNLQCADTGKCYLWKKGLTDGIETWSPQNSCDLNMYFAGVGICRAFVAAIFIFASLIRMCASKANSRCCTRLSSAWLGFPFYIFWFIWLIIGSVWIWRDHSEKQEHCDASLVQAMYILMIYWWIEILPLAIFQFGLLGILRAE